MLCLLSEIRGWPRAGPALPSDAGPQGWHSLAGPPWRALGFAWLSCAAVPSLGRLCPREGCQSSLLRGLCPIAPWATRWCLVSRPGTWSHSQTALAVELTPAIPAGGVSEGALGSRWALCGKGSSCPSGPVQIPALPVPANKTARLLEGPGLELLCSQTLA